MHRARLATNSFDYLEYPVIRRDTPANMADSDKAEAIMPAVEEPDHITVKDGRKLESDDNDFEVFKQEDGAVDFRTVPWIQASIIFLKSKQYDNLCFLAKLLPELDLWAANQVYCCINSHIRHGSFINPFCHVCSRFVSRCR